MCSNGDCAVVNVSQSQNLTAARHRGVVGHPAPIGNRNDGTRVTPQRPHNHTTWALSDTPPFHTLSHVSCWSSWRLYCHAIVSIRPFIILLLQLLKTGSGPTIFAASWVGSESAAPFANCHAHQDILNGPPFPKFPSIRIARTPVTSATS